MHFQSSHRQIVLMPGATYYCRVNVKTFRPSLCVQCSTLHSAFRYMLHCCDRTCGDIGTPTRRSSHRATANTGSGTLTCSCRDDSHKMGIVLPWWLLWLVTPPCKLRRPIRQRPQAHPRLEYPDPTHHTASYYLTCPKCGTGRNLELATTTLNRSQGYYPWCFVVRPAASDRAHWYAARLPRPSSRTP